MIRTDLGAVTAYAAAKAKGYTGTETQFEEDMAALSDNASKLNTLYPADTTLTLTGKAADAKAVGDQLTLVRQDNSKLGDGVYSDYVDVPLAYGWIATNQGVGGTVTYTVNADSGWRHCVVDCRKGDKFDIDAIGGNTPKAWCFVDSDDKIVSVSTVNANVLTLIAPVDGRMIFNSSVSSNTPHCKYAASAKTDIDTSSAIILSQAQFGNFDYYETINKDHVIYTGNISIGGTVDMIPYFKTYGIGSIVVPCKQGDKFEICGKTSDAAGNFRLWCFIDSSNVIISRSTTDVRDTTASPITITAPANAAKLICNMDYPLSGSYLLKTYEAEKLTKAVEQYKTNPYLSYDYSDEIRSHWAVSIGSVGSTIGTPYVSQTYSLYEIPCNANDIFEVWAYNDTGTLSTWAFVNSSGVILSKSQNTSFESDLYIIKKRITAPANAVKLYVNVKTSVHPDSYVIKLGNYTNNQPTAVNDNLQEYKYIMPEWAEVFPFVEKAYTKSQDFVDFPTLYQAFHALNKAGVIEEINMSTAYLASQSDTIPSYITNIQNGGMYMWHIVAPATDGSTYSTKHKKLKVVLFSGLHGSEKKSIWDMYFMLKDIRDGSAQRGIQILRNFFDIYVCPLACPYGINENTRVGYNGINMNRDFWNPYWARTEDSGSTYNLLYETRCASWWIEQLAPDLVIDHHTSTGDNSFENGKFLMWGDSVIPAYNSLIEQVIMEMSPRIRDQYQTLFGSYDWIFGHTQNIATYMNYGTLPLFSYFKTKAISMTFEVVLGVKWDDVTIISNSDADQTALMTIDYSDWMNLLLATLRESVKVKNGYLRID